MKEQNIQTNIKNKLKKAGWVVLKLTVVSYAGFPDLLCLKKPGRVAFVEVKKPGNNPTALQKYWLDFLLKMGFDARVAYSVDDVQSLGKPQNKTS